MDGSVVCNDARIYLVTHLYMPVKASLVYYRLGREEREAAMNLLVFAVLGLK